MPVKRLLDLNPDILFEEHTISEIEDIHKKLQTEIERKREELRTMVGERYRDLIEAADTISDMKRTAEGVITHIDKMSIKCQELQQKHLLGFKLESQKSKLESSSKNKIYHSIAIQIKILTIIPEQIWSAIEEENYLLSSQLFLLARHINTGLELFPSSEGVTASKIATCFPVIAQLWSSMSLFRVSIPTSCELKLQQHKLTAEEACNCLCSLVLLEGLGPLELLNKLLSLRKQALEEMLQSEEHVNVKTRICNSLNLLVRTIFLLHACFVDGCPNESPPEGLVWKQLKNIVGREAQPTLALIYQNNSIGMKFLPPHIQEYRPSTRDKVEAVAPSEMRESLSCWLEWVQDFTSCQVGKLLQLVSSVRSLQSIRIEANKSVNIPANWDVVCQKLLIPKGLDLWENYFQPLLTSRAKELISMQWENALHDSCFPTLREALTQVSAEKCLQTEHDLRWFIWKERVSDLPQLVSSTTKTLQARGLLMKAKGYSPCIEKLCAKFDVVLEAIINDLNHYVNDRDSALIVTGTNRFSDSAELQDYLRTASVKGVQKLVDFIHSICKEIDKGNKRNESCLLLLARFLQAVCDLCPNLQKCLVLSSHKTSHQEGSFWPETCLQLRQQSLVVWHNWLEVILSHINNYIKSSLERDMNMAELLHSFPQWDVVTIEEEGEEGHSIKSDIRVPSQPSLPLQSLLNLVTQKLNAVAPHTLPRKIHQDLIEQFVAKIYDSYVSLCQRGIGQPQALQYLLDVKYITLLLVPRDNKVLMNKSQEICDKLEDRIDPFDLDVFCPYIQNNIKRSVQRTQSLLGILIAWPDKLAVVSGLRAPSNNTAMVDPSVLPLCNGAPWFPLLPVTGPPGLRTPATVVPQPVEKPQQKKKTPIPKAKGDPTPGDIVRSGAAAFFGAMSSDWFGSG